MESMISVIVPVYKIEKYLDRCIESIVGQSYSNLEIILVDDGSPDNCPQICDEWNKKDPRIRVIHQKNGGLSSARNTGIRAAQGEYLYFVDSDDWISQDLCEKAMKVFSLYNVDIVTFDCERVTESGKRLGGTEKLKNGVLHSKDALKELLLGNINNYAWNKIYKREIFRNIWFPEGRTFEDMAITYKLFLNADKIYCMNEQLYYYVQRNDSITATINSQKLCDVFLARHECYMNLEDFYPDVAEIIYPRVVLCAIHLYDRSLWETTDDEVLNAAVDFLRDNKEKILRTERSITYRLYFVFPNVYKALRLMKHYVGNLVKILRRNIKRYT